MKKQYKQILLIIFVALGFIGFDSAVYQLFTKRCISNDSKVMQAKSIELEDYLPFEEDSKVVKVKSEWQLSGDLPVLDGAAALYPVFSAFVHAVYPEDSVIFNGEDFVSGSCLQMNNTRGAYKAVVDGTSDIVICAKPSKEQLEYAKEQGVELVQVSIGNEAFVFLINANNPIDSLTVDELRGIYTGKYTNWSQLGGLNKPISALCRNNGSGSQTAMLSFMGDEKIKKDYDSFIGSAIGYSFRYYVGDIVFNGGVKMLALNGVYPNRANIANGTYPIVSHFYAVFRKDNANENIPKLIDWMLSDEGQRIIEETGYIGIENNKR